MTPTTRREFLRAMAAGSAGLALGATDAPAAGDKMRKPNILFLMTDQHRADCLGCAGNTVIKTPNFDRIAREGVMFTHAYSSTPTCTPARAAVLTGLSPWRHGMLGYGKVAERYPYEMPRAMADAGYYTFAIGKLHYHPQRNYHGFHGALLDESGRAQSPGFISDYRKWFKEKASGLDPDATGVGWNSYLSKPYALPEELHPTRWTGDKAVEFITDYKREEPFLLKVSFARPHSPYDAPQRLRDMYKEADMPAPHVGDWAARFAPVDDPKNDSLWHGDLGLDQVRRSRHGYYGNVTFIDEQAGRILKALEERGMLDNTLVLFTSDHGDMLGDHHHWRKSYAYEGSSAIPMLVRWPESLAPKAERGRKLPQPIELRDVLPTFLDAAGARDSLSPSKGSILSASKGAGLDGDSVLKLVRGETAGWREWIDLEHAACYAKENAWTGLTDGRWKYIYRAYEGREQLFDLKNDPGELHDLAPQAAHAGTLKTWRERMVKHLSERGEQFVKDGKLVRRPEAILHSPNFPDERPEA